MSTRLVEASAVRDFAVLAEQYIALVESAAGGTAGAFLRAVHPLLARLYAGALARPDLEPSGGPDAERAGERERVARLALGALIGERRLYREVFDAYDFEGEPVVGDLADDFASVYGELWGGLQLWRQGRAQDAVWEWRFSFGVHWSEHATSALRALRTLAFVYDLDLKAPPADPDA